MDIINYNLRPPIFKIPWCPAAPLSFKPPYTALICLHMHETKHYTAKVQRVCFPTWATGPTETSSRGFIVA